MWSGIYLGLTALMVLPAMSYTDQSNQEDERTIRSMVEQAVSRLNKGDVTAVDDFWAQDADYISVDGRGMVTVGAIAVGLLIFVDTMLNHARRA